MIYTKKEAEWRVTLKYNEPGCWKCEKPAGGFQWPAIPNSIPMPEKKISEKRNRKENPKKKEKSQYGLPKETLEKILEEKSRKEEFPAREENESILSEEELKMLSKLKNEKKNLEENEIINIPQQRKIFLERELESETPATKSQQNKNQNSFGYIPKNSQNPDAGKKYINYEPNPDARFEKPGEISGTLPGHGREAGFISAINPQSQKLNEPKYETYIPTKNMSPEEMREESKKRRSIKFTSKEVKMHYYDD